MKIFIKKSVFFNLHNVATVAFKELLVEDITASFKYDNEIGGDELAANLLLFIVLKEKKFFSFLSFFNTVYF